MKSLLLLAVSSALLLGFSFAVTQPADEQSLELGTSTVNSNKDMAVEKKYSGMDRADVSSSPANQGPGIGLFSFNGAEPSWYTVNDDVMGGISNSAVVIDKELQRLSFSGDVSLANNGGFASTRSQWTGYDLSAFDGIALRVRGDGNTYRFRVHTEKTGPEIAYTVLFATKSDSWQEIYIPFSEMIPLYRGFIVNAAGPIDPQSVRSFGLMLADKQQGEFSLEVDWINAVVERKVETRLASNEAEQVFVTNDIES